MIGFRPAATIASYGVPGRNGVVGQMMQFLEIRIAQHQAIVGVPQHEGFRDGLDGVAQPQIGRHGALDQAFLFGDVDGDADQMQAGFAVLARQFAAHPQPQPACRRRGACGRRGRSTAPWRRRAASPVRRD